VLGNLFERSNHNDSFLFGFGFNKENWSFNDYLPAHRRGGFPFSVGKSDQAEALRRDHESL
jgi:hypothetical protein